MKDHGSARVACRRCNARSWLTKPKAAEVLALYNDGTTAMLCAKHAAQAPTRSAVLLELAAIHAANGTT